MAAAGGLDVAGLEQAEGALGDIGEPVGHDRVQAWLVEGELDEAALGGLQVKDLGAAVSRPGRSR